MQFLGNFDKIVCWRPPPEGRRPLLWGILDPPLWPMYCIGGFSYFRGHRDSQPLSTRLSLLPPAIVCEGYVFTGVCLSTEGGGGVSAFGPGGCVADTPPPDTPSWQTPPSGQTTSPPPAGRRSTSGLYTSNWNAFLFSFSFSKILV